MAVGIVGWEQKIAIVCEQQLEVGANKQTRKNLGPLAPDGGACSAILHIYSCFLHLELGAVRHNTRTKKKTSRLFLSRMFRVALHPPQDEPTSFNYNGAILIAGV